MAPRSTPVVLSLAAGALAGVTNVCVQKPYNLMADFREYEPAKSYCAPHFPAQTVTKTLPPRCLTTTSTVILATETVTTTSHAACPTAEVLQKRQWGAGWGGSGSWDEGWDWSNDNWGSDDDTDHWGSSPWWEGSDWWGQWGWGSGNGWGWGTEHPTPSKPTPSPAKPSGGQKPGQAPQHAKHCEGDKDCSSGEKCYHDGKNWWHDNHDHWWCGGDNHWWGGSGSSWSGQGGWKRDESALEERQWGGWGGQGGWGGPPGGQGGSGKGGQGQCVPPKNHQHPHPHPTHSGTPPPYHTPTTPVSPPPYHHPTPPSKPTTTPHKPTTPNSPPPYHTPTTPSKPTTTPHKPTTPVTPPPYHTTTHHTTTEPESGWPMPTGNGYGGDNNGGHGGSWGSGSWSKQKANLPNGWKRDAAVAVSAQWASYSADLVQCGYDCIQTACSCVAATKTEHVTPAPTCTETKTKETIVHITQTIAGEPRMCEHGDLR